MTSASSNHLIRERTFPKVYRTAKLTALKKGNRYIVDNMERRKPIAKHEAKPTIRVFIERLGRQPLSPDMPTAAVAARPVKLEEGSSPIKDLKSIATNDQGDWRSSNMSEGNGNRCKGRKRLGPAEILPFQNDDTGTVCGCLRDGLVFSSPAS